MLPAARDFIADATAHRKFVAYVEDAMPLLEKAIGAEQIDDGFVLLKTGKDTTTFLAECRKVRFWDRTGAEP